jgi:ribonucleoside-diphosphate reductase alpha chain
MFVIKRSGKREPVAFDKIATRIDKLTESLNTDYVCVAEIAQKVVSGMYDNVTTVELDLLAAQTAAQMTVIHHDYARLGGRLLASNLQKMTLKSFVKTMRRLFDHVDAKTGVAAPLVGTVLMAALKRHGTIIDAAIDHARDFDYDYFGFKTLERSYLMRINQVVVERPQHMLMRVALGIHGTDIDSALQTYEHMSKGHFTHATPTLFHAGTPRPQLSSCFLMQVRDDSIDGIFETLAACAKISKHAGGLGVSITNVRASGSSIQGTGGASNGIVPMLRVFDAAARYVDQGGGKRKGSIAVYIEPWHADIEAFLEMKKNHGKEELRARDLFYALWTPDLFMRRIETDGYWTLMCPNECPGLDTAWGATFDDLYTSYELAGRGRTTIRARELWFKILDAQIETGTPYVLYKDQANAKHNQQHLGALKCSNLCCEILEYVAPDEVAVCNLASIALPKCVVVDDASGERRFDFEALRAITRIVTQNLNKVIDVNFYPVVEAALSNKRHRPVGIGVQGLADVFAMLQLPFESDEAQALNRTIFEHIYYAAIDASCELARKDGAYETYAGSQASHGRLQFDLWEGASAHLVLDWSDLRARVRAHGLRNSLLVAPMPTASTAQVLGNNECFEPFTSNVYTRRVLSGEFTIVNKHLINDLVELKLWNASVRNAILANDGSVQQIDSIPTHVKSLYKTVWEISQKTLIDMSAARGAFIDQSQSLNLFVEAPTYAKLTSMHFYAWGKKLKTGMYYLRSRPAARATPVTVEAEREACSIANREACEMCAA